jgi:hypothetical protein
MKEVKFKIIELQTHQILFTKDFDNEREDESSCLMVVTFFLEGVKLDLKLSYDSEQKRDKMFDEFDEIKSQNLLDKMIAQIGR